MKKISVMITTIVVFLATMLNVHAYESVEVQIKVKGDPNAEIQIESEKGAPLPEKTNIVLGKNGEGSFVLNFDEPEDYHYTITRTDKNGFGTYSAVIQVINDNQGGLEENVVIADQDGNKTEEPEFITPQPSEKPSPTPSEKPIPTPSGKPTPTPSGKPTPKAETKKQAPDTGDHSNTGMMIAVFAGAMLVITAVTVIRKKQSD